MRAYRLHLGEEALVYRLNKGLRVGSFLVRTLFGQE